MRHLLLAVVCAVIIGVVPRSGFATSYKEFSDEFRKNPEAFKQKYIGKAVSVTGTVGIIELDPSRSGPGSGPAIGFMDLDKEVIRCYLNDEDKARALTVGKGDTVTFTGTFLRANVAGLHIDPCSFH